MSAVVQVVLVRCLVTVMLDREFHAPGTEISVSVGDAARLVQIGAAVVVEDPGVVEDPDVVEDPGVVEDPEEETEPDAGDADGLPDPAAGEGTPAAATGTRRGRRR